MKVRPMLFITPLVIGIALVGCSWNPQPRNWPDLHYPPQVIGLEIKTNASMSNEQAQQFQEAIVKALKDRNIAVDSKVPRRLMVEVVNYNVQSVFRAVITTGGPWARYTSNTLDLKVTLVTQTGERIDIPRFSAMRESDHVFQYLLESMARQIADVAFTADALPDQG